MALLVFIIITVVVVGIIVVCCKRRKSKLRIKESVPPESNLEMPRSKKEEHDSENPMYVNIPGSIHSAEQLHRVTIQDYMNFEVIRFTEQSERMQDNGPHYINTESIHPTKQAGKDTMKHNHYDVPKQAGKDTMKHDHYDVPKQAGKDTMKDNHYDVPKQAGKDTMKDNHYDVPSVIPFGQVKIQDNPAYTGGITNTEVQYSYADTAYY